MLNYQGNIVLITGAAQGLGLEYAKSFLGRGATVIMQDSGANKEGVIVNPEGIFRTVETLNLASGHAVAKNSDISNQMACQNLIDEIIERYQRIDIIIHNAGWVGYQSIDAWDESIFDRMMSITTKTPLWLIQAAWPTMVQQQFGRIIVTTSDRAIYSQYSQMGLISYAAAKMAILGAMNILAQEGEQHNIRINAISPVAKTRMWGITEQPHDLQPELVSPGILYLASSLCDESGWILRASNGQFHATKYFEAANVRYPIDLAAINANSPEEIHQNWAPIAIKNIEPRYE